MTLAKTDNTSTALASTFEPANMSELLSLADMLSRSTLIPGTLRGKPGDVAVILLHGRELGLSPMRALSEIYVVDGKPSASSTLKVGLCVKHANVCKYFRAIEVTDKIATYETQRAGSEPVRFSYTIEDAARAGLTGRSTWKAHPKQMLSARAKSVLATMVYPDLVGNLYDPDEAQDIRESQSRRPVSEPPPVAPQVEVVAQAEIVVPENAGDAWEPPVERSAAYTAAANALAEADTLDALKAVASRITAAKDLLSTEERESLRLAYTGKRNQIGGGK